MECRIFFMSILPKIVTILSSLNKEKQVVSVIFFFTCLLQTKHMLLTDHGAQLFAQAMGVPEIPGEKLITERSRERWKKNLEPDSNPVEFQK